MKAGALEARTGAFVSGSARETVHPLPYPALCVSRFTLDALLAQRFRQLDGLLQEKARWRPESGPDPHKQLGDKTASSAQSSPPIGNESQNISERLGFQSTRHNSTFPEGTVRATGRRPQPTEGGWRWFGLKVHARGVDLRADLEMHLLTHGYVGLCHLKDGEVNLCGLFRRPAAACETPLAWGEMLRGVAGSSLHERLKDAVFDESSFCSVAGLSLRHARAASQDGCCIGDAITMTPPVTGNGMSMAFESAELALAPLAAYSRGELSWAEACRSIARACDQAFTRRLAWAKWLQWLMFAPFLRGGLSERPLRSEWFWRFMFSKTR
jgi:hypothetical protein